MPATTALLPGSKPVNEMHQHSYTLARQHFENQLLLLDQTRQSVSFQNCWSMLGGGRRTQHPARARRAGDGVQERQRALRACLGVRAP